MNINAVAEMPRHSNIGSLDTDNISDLIDFIGDDIIVLFLSLAPDFKMMMSAVIDDFLYFSVQFYLVYSRRIARN